VSASKKSAASAGTWTLKYRRSRIVAVAVMAHPKRENRLAGMLYAISANLFSPYLTLSRSFDPGRSQRPQSVRQRVEHRDTRRPDHRGGRLREERDGALVGAEHDGLRSRRRSTRGSSPSIGLRSLECGSPAEGRAEARPAASMGKAADGQPCDDRQQLDHEQKVILRPGCRGDRRITSKGTCRGAGRWIGGVGLRTTTNHTASVGQLVEVVDFETIAGVVVGALEASLHRGHGGRADLRSLRGLRQHPGPRRAGVRHGAHQEIGRRRRRSQRTS
jgi:hypothetical protein